MEEGVYVYSNKEDNVRRVTFIEIKSNGYAYGRKEFVVKRISFIFTNPALIFPLIKERNYNQNEIYDYSPLLMCNDCKSSLLSCLTEGSPMYEYYKKNFVQCNVPFRVIEHLYENFSSLKKTFKDIAAFLSEDISI